MAANPEAKKLEQREPGDPGVKIVFTGPITIGGEALTPNKVYTVTQARADKYVSRGLAKYYEPQ
jgi:hypothetical protein